jgi:hypothetical protein
MPSIFPDQSIQNYPWVCLTKAHRRLKILEVQFDLHTLLNTVIVKQLRQGVGAQLNLFFVPFVFALDLRRERAKGNVLRLSFGAQS